MKYARLRHIHQFVSHDVWQTVFAGAFYIVGRRNPTTHRNPAPSTSKWGVR